GLREPHVWFIPEAIFALGCSGTDRNLPGIGVPAGAGQAVCREAGGPPYSEARVVAEHGGDRVVGAGPAVPGPTTRVGRGARRGGGGVGDGPERADGGGEIAIHDGGRPDQAPPTLLDNSIEAVY